MGGHRLHVAEQARGCENADPLRHLQPGRRRVLLLTGRLLFVKGTAMQTLARISMSGDSSERFRRSSILRSRPDHAVRRKEPEERTGHHGARPRPVVLSGRRRVDAEGSRGLVSHERVTVTQRR